MILYVLVLRTLLKKILLALPGVPIKAEFITRYNANGTINSPNGTVGTIGKPMVPLATNGTIGKITIGTIGRAPNRAIV